MKNYIFLTVISFLLLSCQSLERITENGKSGWRLSTANPENYGPIGKEALDLSYCNGPSGIKGATGDYSTAIGYQTTASGWSAIAMGGGTTASSNLSVAMGRYATASGDYSVAFGDSTVASGIWSSALGHKTTASGDWSVAMGDYSTASSDHCFAMGSAANASGSGSIALGGGTTASGMTSTAMGLITMASGNHATSMGFRTKASDRASLTIGEWNSVNNVVTSEGSDFIFRHTNAAFVIGNGTEDVRSDAFVVYFNGNATLAGELSVNSDARLKDNIQPLGSTLDKLHQIEGKTYTFLKDEEHTPKIGVLAQEVQSVFPELVSEGVDGTLSVNYQGLVPVLINAINEQEAKMSEQDAKIAALEAQNEEIKEMLRALTLQQSIAVND